MFAPEQRSQLRSDLLAYASQDPRISAGAITGSAATGNEDQWSDIDLAFGVAAPSGVHAVLSDWTTYMYDRHRALHHLDVIAGAWIYRVFLLPSTLQVDLAFVPAAEFRPLATTFRLVFGEAGQPSHAADPSPSGIIGFAWLYALHARSCMARRKLWQGEYMISGMRDHALALACLRHRLPAVHGRGFDQLPAELAARFEGSLVRRLDAAELSRAFQVVTYCLLDEVRSVDPELAGRLEEALICLSEPPV